MSDHDDHEHLNPEMLNEGRETPQRAAMLLAMRRAMGANPSEHLAAIGANIESSREDWVEAADFGAHLAMHLANNVAHENGEDDPTGEQAARSMVLVGFMFGRAFEEMQILAMSEDPDFLFSGKTDET